MSTITKSMSQFIFRDRLPASGSQPANLWRNDWPNTPDFTFNYANLIAQAEETGFALGLGENLGKSIAIIGAGIAGLTVARELLRCGYQNITLLEATDRIGGRNFSIPAPGNDYTVYEMGAMRIPYFGGQSALHAYAKQFSITSQNFPDPSSPGNTTGATTGVFYNRGYGPVDFSTGQPAHAVPTMDDPQSNDYPSVYRQIAHKVSNFGAMFDQRFKAEYGKGDESFRNVWSEYVKIHGGKSFREFAVSAMGDSADPSYPAGMGLSEAEAKVFGTIGAGDGSWGAFFALSAMYPIRTLMCGFGGDSNNPHQLIQGVFPQDERPPVAGKEVADTHGQPFGNINPDNKNERLGPAFLGVQSFAECLMFSPMKSGYTPVNGKSPYDLMTTSGKNGHLAFYTRTRIVGAQLAEDGSKGVTLFFPDGASHTYHAAVDTTTTWAGQMGKGRDSSQKDVFSDKKFPFSVVSGYKDSHWITSCKIFAPLLESFWTTGIPQQIPQVIVSDTWLQDSYGYASQPVVSGGDPDTGDAGVLLVSYTWEDDALKMIADASDEGSEAALAKDALAKLEDILRVSQKESLTKYLGSSPRVVIHWMTEPSYRGCAKLYHPGREYENFALASYNENYAKDTGYYLAGEAFSLYGGWTEPAVRHALDAVLHFLNNDGAQFNISEFDFDRDYPKYGSNPYVPASSPDARKK